jgi:hypothetical protein
MAHLPWKYEPRGFEFEDGISYLPDFWLPSENAWFEIKPDSFDPILEIKAVHLSIEGSANVYIAVGKPAWPYDRPNGQVYKYTPFGRILSGYKWTHCERSGRFGLTWGGNLDDLLCHVHLVSEQGLVTGRIITATVLARLALFGVD